MDLEKVANVIVDHSLQDCVFSKEAGRMCYAIIQVGGGTDGGQSRCLQMGSRPGQQHRGMGWVGFPGHGPHSRAPLVGLQAESQQAGQSVFRRGLLNRLQQEYQAREQLRARSLRGWVCYVTFICNVFDHLRVRPG